MVQRGMMELTGAPSYITAWSKLFSRNDVVGIKVNPNGISSIVSSKAVVLSIIDGVHGLWNAGPQGSQNFVWDHRTMYFGTDVVATDRIGWKAIDAQRVLAGLPPEESSGADGWDSWSIRQPQHITQAGQNGLGEFRDDHIDYRLVTLA
jgi:hypothetical protein